MKSRRRSLPNIKIDADARELYVNADLHGVAEGLITQMRQEAKDRWGFALPRTRWSSEVWFHGSTASVCFTCAGGHLRFWDVEFNVEGRTKVTIVSSRVELL